MSKNTDTMDAAAQLRLLSMSDEKTRTNMMRHILATRMLLTGKHRDCEVAKIALGACFGVTDAAEVQLTELTRQDGCDRVCIGFDVDDPQGPPSALGLCHRDGDAVLFFETCTFWSPPGGDRAGILVGGGGGWASWHLSYRPGRGLVRVERDPGESPEAGIRRASARYRKLATSAVVRTIAVEREAYMWWRD